jgi:hypothetical protein
VIFTLIKITEKYDEDMWKNISLTLQFFVFDENMCDTLMCVEMVQNLFVIELMSKSKKKGGGKMPQAG